MRSRRFGTGQVPWNGGRRKRYGDTGEETGLTGMARVAEDVDGTDGRD